MLKHRVALLFTLLSIFFVLSERPAYALYVDPGSGTFLWQVFCAAVIGGVYYVRGTLYGMLRGLRRLVGSRGPDSQKP
jgi:hypothetical protein